MKCLGSVSVRSMHSLRSVWETLMKKNVFLTCGKCDRCVSSIFYRAFGESS